MPRFSKIAVALQFILCSAAVFAVAFSAWHYYPLYVTAVSQISSSVSSAKQGVDATIELLRTARTATSEMSKGLENYSKLVVQTAASFKDITGSVLAFRSDITRTSELLMDTSTTLQGYESMIPIEFSWIKFDKFQKVAISYPTGITSDPATINYVKGLNVNMEDKKIKYPKGARVKTSNFGLGKGFGSIDYPSGIDFDEGEVVFNFPKSASPQMAQFTYPTNFKTVMKDISFDLPTDVVVEKKSFFHREKDIITKARPVLESVSKNAKAFAETLSRIDTELTPQVASAAELTLSSLGNAKKVLQEASDKTLPTYLKELESLQRTTDRASAGLAAPMLPYLIAFLAIEFILLFMTISSGIVLIRVWSVNESGKSSPQVPWAFITALVVAAAIPTFVLKFLAPESISYTSSGLVRPDLQRNLKFARYRLYIDTTADPVENTFQCSRNKQPGMDNYIDATLVIKKKDYPPGGAVNIALFSETDGKEVTVAPPSMTFGRKIIAFGHEPVNLQSLQRQNTTITIRQDTLPGEPTSLLPSLGIYTYQMIQGEKYMLDIWVLYSE